MERTRLWRRVLGESNNVAIADGNSFVEYVHRPSSGHAVKRIPHR